MINRQIAATRTHAPVDLFESGPHVGLMNATPTHTNATIETVVNSTGTAVGVSVAATSTQSVPTIPAATAILVCMPQPLSANSPETLPVSEADRNPSNRPSHRTRERVVAARVQDHRPQRRTRRHRQQVVQRHCQPGIEGRRHLEAQASDRRRDIRLRRSPGSAGRPMWAYVLLPTTSATRPVTNATDDAETTAAASSGTMHRSSHWLLPMLLRPIPSAVIATRDTSRPGSCAVGPVPDREVLPVQDAEGGSPIARKRKRLRSQLWPAARRNASPNVDSVAGRVDRAPVNTETANASTAGSGSEPPIDALPVRRRRQTRSGTSVASLDPDG